MDVLTEFVTVVDHTRLVRSRRGDTIASRCGRRWLVRGRVNAYVVAGPQSTAVRAYSRVPRIKLRQRDVVLRRNVGTSITRLHHLELIAVGHHAGLRGSWSRNAISSLGRGLRRLGGWSGGRTWDANADVVA